MAVKILSVDDEHDLKILLTQYFRKKIRAGEYIFSFAHNGLEALKMMLETPDFDIVLSDINMPEMDGLTLLSKINELRNPALKCIMVSAYGDMENIRTAMNRGAFDFATKPIDLDDLARTIENAIQQIKYVRERQKEHDQLESLKNDLAVAGEIQQAILPRIFPPFPELSDKVDIFASMKAAKDVGGDFYDFFQIDNDRLGFVIADVSGKGVPASLFMAVSRTLIRATGMQGITSNACLTSVNKLLCKESLDSMFVTVFYGIYNVVTGVIDYTNGGHNPPYILRSDNTVEVLPMSKNFILGVFDDFEFQNDMLTIKEGDALVMFTDGVTEAFSTKHEQFDETRLVNSLSTLGGANSQEIIESVITDVENFSSGAEQSDDITMLTIKHLK
ncbi:MAG: SpoIIE family protein phosphatase [Bacteroidaceae bacterium]|nr:SpoIIE family protein phosphatase [Bacteroidaceae bacterium]